MCWNIQFSAWSHREFDFTPFYLSLMLVHIFKLNNLDCLEEKFGFKCFNVRQGCWYPKHILSNKIFACENAITNTWHTMKHKRWYAARQNNDIRVCLFNLISLTMK